MPKKIVTLLFVFFTCSLIFADDHQNTVGHWRFDSENAEVDLPITESVNSANPGTHDASLQAGNPLYSSDTPAEKIYNPIEDEVLENNFSLNATDSNSSLRVPDSEAFNTSFTVEMFIKIVGEPGGWHSFLRRQEGQDLRWQLDFDNSNNGFYYGRSRSRWDTPAISQNE